MHEIVSANMVKLSSVQVKNSELLSNFSQNNVAAANSKSTSNSVPYLDKVIVDTLNAR